MADAAPLSVTGHRRNASEERKTHHHGSLQLGRTDGFELEERGSSPVRFFLGALDVDVVHYLPK